MRVIMNQNFTFIADISHRLNLLLLPDVNITYHNNTELYNILDQIQEVDHTVYVWRREHTFTFMLLLKAIIIFVLFGAVYYYWRRSRSLRVELERRPKLKLKRRVNKHSEPSGSETEMITLDDRSSNAPSTTPRRDIVTRLAEVI